MKNEKLFILLSAYMALECKVRNYHWNVECSNFVEYHEFFEKEYDVLADEIDEIAEQIRKLGEKVPANFENILKSCKASNIDTTNRAEKSSDMILCLIDSNKQIIETIKDLKIEFGESREYMSTCSLLDNLLCSREKDLWFLTSLSN